MYTHKTCISRITNLNMDSMTFKLMENTTQVIRKTEVRQKRERKQQKWGCKQTMLKINTNILVILINLSKPNPLFKRNSKIISIKIRNKTKTSTTTTSGQFFKGYPCKTRKRKQRYRIRKEENKLSLLSYHLIIQLSFLKTQIICKQDFKLITTQMVTSHKNIKNQLPLNSLTRIKGKDETVTKKCK